MSRNINSSINYNKKKPVLICVEITKNKIKIKPHIVNYE
jgi:hypothetical protein